MRSITGDVSMCDGCGVGGRNVSTRAGGVNVASVPPNAPPRSNPAKKVNTRRFGGAITS